MVSFRKALAVSAAVVPLRSTLVAGAPIAVKMPMMDETECIGTACNRIAKKDEHISAMITVQENSNTIREVNGESSEALTSDNAHVPVKRNDKDGIDEWISGWAKWEPEWQDALIAILQISFDQDMNRYYKKGEDAYIMLPDVWVNYLSREKVQPLLARKLNESFSEWAARNTNYINVLYAVECMLQDEREIELPQAICLRWNPE